MLMVHIASLSSTPKLHGLLQRDLQLIHPTSLALHVNLFILLMSHLTPTINCSKINLVKYLIDMLELTVGMDLPSYGQKLLGKSSRECSQDTTSEELEPHIKFLR